MYPKNIPIPFPITRVIIPGSNYQKGRDTWTPDMIVIHCTEGSRAATISTFQSTARPVSAHFLVCKTGEIVQFVASRDTAYGNGIQVRPRDPVVLARDKNGINPNLYTISIEHEILGMEVPTKVQYAASAQLMKLMSDTWGIPLDSKHVIPHNAIDAAKTCPNNVDINHLLALANGACV